MELGGFHTVGTMHMSTAVQGGILVNESIFFLNIFY